MEILRVLYKQESSGAAPASGKFTKFTPFLRDIYRVPRDIYQVPRDIYRVPRDIYRESHPLLSRITP
jgi:hypothetical protein